MLIYHIHRSMDSILEGIDKGSPRMILEANAKFVEGVNGLKSSIEQFSKLIGEAGVEGLKPTYEALYKEVQELEGKLDEVPDTFSYKAQLKLLSSDSDDQAPESMVTKIALAHDSNVTGMKDAIIEISKTLEGMKEVFSVGTKGIFLQPEFQKLTANPDDIYLGVFGSSPSFALNILSGQELPKGNDGYDEGELQKAKDHWKPIWNPDGAQGDEKWDSFLGGFEKVAEGITKAYDAAGKAIQSAKPSPEFQSEVPTDGIIGSLMGGLFGSLKGGSDIKADPKLIMGENFADEKGLLGIPFPKFSALVSGLIEMSGNATEAAAGAVKVVKDNQEQQVDPDDAAAVKKHLIDKYDEKEGTPEDYPQAFKAMAAFEVIFKGAENISMKAIKDKASELLELLTQVEIPKGENTTVKFEEDEIKRLLGILEIEGDEEEAGGFLADIQDKGRLAKNLKNYLKDEGYPDIEENIDTYQKLILKFIEDGNYADPSIEQNIEDGMIDNGEVGKFFSGGGGDFSELHGLINLGDNDELFNFFKDNAKGLQEARLILRWGRLAGIIKG